MESTNRPAMKCYAVVSVVMAMLLVGVASSPVPQESDASFPTWRTRGVKPVQEDKAAYIKSRTRPMQSSRGVGNHGYERYEPCGVGAALVRLMMINVLMAVISLVTLRSRPPIMFHATRKLEAELVTAVEAGAVAEAVKMEQQLEDEILVSAVRTLYKDRDDKNKLEEDKKMIAELVNRDKRAVELLSGVLGGSSGGGSSGISSASPEQIGKDDDKGGEGSEDGGGSNVLSLITPLLGSSSGGGGDDGEGGGGSDILGLLGPLLGGLSGPANFPDPATNTKLLTPILYRVEEMMKTGEEEVLISLVPSLDSWEDSVGTELSRTYHGYNLASSAFPSDTPLHTTAILFNTVNCINPLTIQGDGADGEGGGGSDILGLLAPILGGLSGGGGDDGADGGGSNVLSLLSGLLGGSSGGGGDGEAGGGSNVLSLLSGLLGSSSGGGGDGEDGGGSNVLSLVSGLFGSSSGGGGASVGGSVSYKGATYDDLIKQSRDENSFNPISLLTNSISQVLQHNGILAFLKSWIGCDVRRTEPNSPTNCGEGNINMRRHVPAFAWRESGKPFSKITVSTPNQNQNPHIPVIRSLVQHDNDALDHAATEEGSLPVQLKEVSQRMPDSSVANLHVQCASMCYRNSQKNRTRKVILSRSVPAFVWKERERVEYRFGKTTLSTPDRDSNTNLPVICSLVYCESSALDHEATEAGGGSDGRAEIISYTYVIN
uniref:(California timema) hypothetical protein n=1 Tax=Timema californicum TaxID=61474 RepID=A0A7R9IW24_TIMCA|nr:unnamed protein product [Timema californicum]